MSTDSCSKQDALVTAVNSQKTTRAHDANLNTSIVSNSPIRQVHSHPGLIYTPASSFLLTSTLFKVSLSARYTSLFLSFPLQCRPLSQLHPVDPAHFPSAEHLRTFEVQIELTFDLVRTHPSGLVYTPFIIHTRRTFESISLGTLHLSLSPLHLNPCLSPTSIQ